MNRHFALCLVPILLAGAFAACADGGKTPIKDAGDQALDVADVGDVADPGPDADAGPDADVPTPDADVDAPDVEVPPAKPELSFAIVTATGPRGQDQATVDLVKADEPAAYADSPGFQVDVAATATNLEVGRSVNLLVAGNVVATVQAAAGTGGQVTAAFTAVTLTHNPAGYEVKVEATNAAGEAGEAVKTVRVDIGTCGIALTPTNTACVLADADPDTAGLQVVFSVTNPDRTCTTARLEVTANGGTTTAGPVTLDASGAATVLVTLLDTTDGVDGVEVAVVAEVSDDASPDRTARTASLAYVADLVDPVLTLDEPAKASLTLADDKDGDPLNGLTFDAAGTATGTAAGSGISVTLNGADAGAPVPDAQGAWRVADLNATADGGYLLVAVGRDACGREGRAERSFQAKVTQASLSIASPSANAVLLAKDDGNPATPLVYETSLGVQGDAVTAGTTLTARCREDRFGTPELVVGSLAVDTPAADGQYAVSVTLSVQALTAKVRCRVTDDAPNPSASGEVPFVVALPAPELRILQPAAGAAIKTASLGVVLAATNLNGIVPAVRVLDGVGVEALAFTPAAAIKNGGLVFTMPLTVGGQPLADGAWTLDVQAADAFGNQAADTATSRTQVAFTLDTLAPEVTITAPAADTLDPVANPGDADQDPATPGYQASIVVTVTAGGGAGTKVCLTVNGDQACKVLADGETAATFDGITLVPGANALSAQATDASGNVGPASARTVTLVLAGPRVRIVTPDRNGPVAVLPFDLSVKVTDAADVAQADAPVTVSVNGTDTYTGTTGAAGTATFQVAALSATGDTFVARATVASVEGVSAPRVLSFKAGQPALTFRVPKNEEVINLAYAACAPGVAACTLDVLLDTADIEDGSSGQLTVVCGASTVNYDGFVDANVLKFPAVVLADQQACTLTARATDLASQTVTAGPIQVRLDRVGPRVVAFQNPDPNVGTLTYTYDEDKGLAGLQYSFKVYVTGVEAGSTVTVDYGPVGGTATRLTATVDVDVPNFTNKLIAFPQVTMSNGSWLLTATTADKAGNPSELTRLVDVVVDQPILRLVSPSLVERTACTASSTCTNGGVCAEGFCARPWAAASSKDVIVSVASLPAGVGNVRICSNKAGLAGSPCSTAGYRQVALGSSAGSGNTTVTVAGLPDGSHALVAEGLLASGQPWTSSADSPNAIERFRYVFQDTVLPVVTALTSPSDTAAPSGILNAAEQAAAGRVYQVRVTASEPGALALVLNGVDGPGSAAFTGDLTLDATLREGGNEIHARVTDLVGNVSAQPPSGAVVYYRPTVDTLAPTLSFDNPAGAVLRAGDSRDVVVSSDAVGRTVTLLDGGAQKGTGTVGAGGSVTFPFASLPVLTDGNHDLEARVSDDAGNPATATHAVRVDTVVPDVLLAKPLDGAVLADADDARPGSPGFQIEISFGSPSADAASWQVQLATNCDAAFVACDPPARIAQGAITNAGGLEPSLFPTLPAAASPYYKVIVLVTDGVGNANTSTANLTVNLAECQVAVSGIGTGSWINNQACPVAGTDCASATLSITVSVSTACGAVDTVRLLQSGQAPQEKALTGQSATFTATVADASSPTFEARAFEGGLQSGSSGSLPRTVDLLDPVVAFTAPAAGTDNPWGVKADGNLGAAGLQRTLSAQASDLNLANGQVLSLTFASAAVAPANVALPYDLSAGSANLDFQVTLPDQTTGPAVVTVADAAGNEATSTFTAKVDLQPPAAPTLGTFAAGDVNPRRPSVRLNWSAVADNGSSGVAATAYDIRYSPLPIATDADFDAACPVTGLAYTAAVPAPAAPGTAESFTVTGPDIRNPTVTVNGTPCKFVTGTNPGETNYAFAVRAVDAVGNLSPVTVANVADVDLSFRYARIVGTGTPYSDATMNRRVASVGDLDGDGLGEVAVGGGSTTMAETFCLVYGNATGADLTVPDVTISSATGTNHLCLTGAAGTYFGVPVVEAGDVNGDGVGDLAVGEGKSSAQAVKVWFGVRDGRLAAAPNLTITGQLSNLNSVVLAGAGDFNGDGTDDLLIGSRTENKVFLVPGNATWTAATSLAINLQSAADQATYGIVPFVMTGGDATTRFGFRVAFVGDLDGDGKDEAAVATQAVPSQVIVFKGRVLTGVTAISIALTTGGTDDATVVRLAPDSTTGAGSFGNTMLAGGQDLDRDGSPDILVTHTAAAALAGAKSVYMFRGGYLKTRFGQTVQVLATTGTGTGIVQNEKGFVISGSYDIAVPVGNLDDDADGTADLAYIILATGTNHGKVFVRRNVKDPAGTFGYGTMPWESPVLVDPLDPTGLRFGYFGAYPVRDFNGDGFQDLLVGTDGAGYAMILY